MRRARDEAPFSDRFVLTASGLEESSVLRACARLRDALREVLESGERYRGVSYRLLGPAPAAVAKVNNRYRYHISLICQNQKLIRDLLAHLVRQAQKDKINRGVSVLCRLQSAGLNGGTNNGFEKNPGGGRSQCSTRSAVPVEKFDDRLHTQIDDLKETLTTPNGLGLARPQVES